MRNTPVAETRYPNRNKEFSTLLRIQLRILNSFNDRIPYRLLVPKKGVCFLEGESDHADASSLRKHQFEKAASRGEARRRGHYSNVALFDFAKSAPISLAKAIFNCVKPVANP